MNSGRANPPVVVHSVGLLAFGTPSGVPCCGEVNQHAGICATPPAQDSTGHDIVPCGCDTAKEFQGDLSDPWHSFMMLYVYNGLCALALLLGQSFKQCHCGQVGCDPIR